MESDEVEAQLAAVARAEAAPYIDYPPTPAWYPPLVGAWTAALIGVFRWWREDAVLFTAALVILVAGEVVFLSWMAKRHGAQPRLGVGSPPAEIAAVYRLFFVGLIPTAVLVALAWWLGGVPAGAVAAFVLVTVALFVYERAYDRAARATRARLA